MNTPGPWIACEEKNDGIYLVVAPCEYTVAEVCDKDDANIIAAAPDLLAVAEMVVKYGGAPIIV